MTIEQKTFAEDIREWLHGTRDLGEADIQSGKYSTAQRTAIDLLPRGYEHVSGGRTNTDVEYTRDDMRRDAEAALRRIKEGWCTEADCRDVANKMGWVWGKLHNRDEVMREVMTSAAVSRRGEAPSIDASTMQNCFTAGAPGGLDGWREILHGRRSMLVTEAEPYIERTILVCHLRFRAALRNALCIPLTSNERQEIEQVVAAGIEEPHADLAACFQKYTPRLIACPLFTYDQATIDTFLCDGGDEMKVELLHEILQNSRPVTELPPALLSTRIVAHRSA